MKIDNERDRFAAGFDSGQLVTGKVKYHDELKRYIIVDEDGVGYDIQAALESLKDQEVRVTLVTMSAMVSMQSQLSGDSVS